jgi:peptidyl-prolyl cis-trans isomerase D
MFDFVHRNKRVVQGILGAVMLPFAFWGVYSYDRARAEGDDVATIGRDKISQREFDDAMRDQQNRMRQMLGRNYDPSAFDTPEMRFNLLESLISDRLLRRQAEKENIVVDRGQLQRFIQEIPAFQEDGKFSMSRYDALVRNQNMTPLQFEQRLRSDLEVQPIQSPFLSGAIVAKTTAERYLQLGEQKREVSVANVESAPYLNQVKVDEAAVKAFYDSNQAAYKTPEQVKMEYLVLSKEALMADQSVADDELKQAYEKQYAPAFVEKDKARKKAEEILSQVKKDPNKFAELAKQYSQDPGSAKNGGDLGYFPRGVMVKPFEDTAFRMKVGQVSDLVESDFGYHIIKLTGIKPAGKDSQEERQASHILISAPKEAKDYATAKPLIEQQIRQQKASATFAASAENFQNLVYEQADNLGGVAKTLNLKLQKTDWVSRPQVQALARNNGKLAQAVFSPEAVQSKRNTEVVEVAPDTLMAARVVEHKPSAPRPFEEVKAQIERQLKQREATELAIKAGKEKLAQLEQGKAADLNWGKAQTITRQQYGPEFGPDAVKQIFSASAAKLPAYFGGANQSGGFAIYKLTKVETPPVDDQEKVKSASSRIGEQVARESLTAYVAELKKKSDVKIKQENLEKKQPQ